jgi:hypothetical protein
MVVVLLICKGYVKDHRGLEEGTWDTLVVEEVLRKILGQAVPVCNPWPPFPSDSEDLEEMTGNARR